MDMFRINKYLYVDRHTRNKFEVYARNELFADKLIERINAIGVFDLRRAKIRFCKVMESDISPYELEQEQLETIERWEAHANEQEKIGNTDNDVAES